MVEKRIGVGTIKWICFQVLKEAGPQGLLLSEIVERTQEKGLKDWTSVRQPSNTVNACCSGDPAFVKVAPARVGLACLGAYESKEIADEEEKAAGRVSKKAKVSSSAGAGPLSANFLESVQRAKQAEQQRRIHEALQVIESARYG